jgi:hypothetical protein
MAPDGRLMPDVLDLTIWMKQEAIRLSRSSRRAVAELRALYADHPDLGPALVALGQEVVATSEHVGVILSLCQMNGETIPSERQLV